MILYALTLISYWSTNTLIATGRAENILFSTNSLSGVKHLLDLHSAHWRLFISFVCRHLALYSIFLFVEEQHDVHSFLCSCCRMEKSMDDWNRDEFNLNIVPKKDENQTRKRVSIKTSFVYKKQKSMLSSRCTWF